MRRVVVAALSGALLLSACTDDGDPTVDVPPSVSETVDDEPTDDEGSDPADGSSPAASEPTGAPSPIIDPTESEPSGQDVEADLSAQLTGDAEVPGPGDPGGSGTFAAVVTTTEAGGELCYTLRADGLSAEVTAAHIHEGTADVAGGVFIELAAPTEGQVEECLALNATELVPLLDDPSQYYVNVHTAEYPDGAVRGQLAGDVG